MSGRRRAPAFTHAEREGSRSTAPGASAGISGARGRRLPARRAGRARGGLCVWSFPSARLRICSVVDRMTAVFASVFHTKSGFIPAGLQCRPVLAIYPRFSLIFHH